MPGGSLNCATTGLMPTAMSWLATLAVATGGRGAANVFGFADGGANEIDSEAPASLAACN